ncbi:MAG: uncharacterized protein PWQ91_865 [Eubacteriales bacterium]|nr:uncharacterized protein [Eubacteriales bacterium]MDN5363804.1 uncharacterized protein [Eubacteriales bacterium]
MRIGVISDTHGRVKIMREAVAAMGKIDMLLHAGDHITDAEILRAELDVPVYAVRGNCDFYDPGPEEEVIAVGGWKILLTHGHLYRVKYGYQLLAQQAEEKKIDVAVFGHTHIPYNHRHGGVLLFNPGTLSHPRTEDGLTYGILEVGPSGISGTIYHFQPDT